MFDLTLSAMERMQSARAALLDTHPFFGTLSLRLRLIETTDLPTMGVDGNNLYFNPDFVEELSDVRVMGVVAHEVLHCVFQHMYRRQGRDREKWNIANDYVINAILLDEAFSLPPSRLYDPKWRDMPSEEVYAKLPDELVDELSAQPDWNFGSCLDPTDTGEASSNADMEGQSTEWRLAVEQAGMAAKAAGKLPAGLQRIVDEVTEPKIPWERQLWSFLNKRKPAAHSWNRPQRRLAYSGLHLPSKKYIPTGDIVVAIDTSGSMSQSELAACGAELIEIFKAIQPTNIYVLYADSAVDRVDHFTCFDFPDFDTLFRPSGGGGTSFIPPFEWVDENLHSPPDAFVYMTDGYGPFPEHEAEYPTLWLINNDKVVPPHGEHIVLDVVPGEY